jgi:flagellar hook-associated protein 3 FlgL
MISSLDPNTQSFLDSLSQISQRMDRAQRQISSGLKINNASDAPDQISTLLQARADLDANQNIQENLGRVKAEVDAGQSAVSSAVSVLENVQTLGAQGATGTATADSRQQISAQMGSLVQQLGNLSGTQVEGRYIFSGDSDQKPPYTIDLTQSSPVSAYAGSTSTRHVQHPNGTLFAVGKTAQEIFDNPDATKNVFNSVNNLRLALQNNDQAAITSALTDVGTSLSGLNQSLAFYGSAQNKVQDASDFGSNQQLQIEKHISTLQDADMTQAITDFQQASTQQQAALQMWGKVPRTTLFDFLA